MTAEVCLQCGERLYPEETVRRFEQIRQKLAKDDVAGFVLLGQTYQVGLAGQDIIGIMDATLTHDRTEETIEAKTLWFRSLSLAEQMEIFCAFTELLLMTNPQIVEQKNAEPVEGRVRVLTAA